MEETACTPTKIFARGFLGGKSELVITSDFSTRTLYRWVEDSKTKIKTKVPLSGFHSGVDLRCSVGTPITCPVDRAVIHKYTVGELGGKQLHIKYNNGKEVFFIIFMHLSQCPYTNADIGKELRLGDLIGQTGNSGRDSTGSHLHLEIRRNTNVVANAVDPKVYFLSHHILRIKTSTSWVGIPYNGNGYVNGINSYFTTQKNFFSDGYVNTLNSYFKNQTHFCSEDCLTINDVKLGQSAAGSEVTNVEIVSNDETEIPMPKKRSIPELATERLALGIWQITKMVMDSSVQGKQLCDSSIGIQTGSMMSFFQKACQQPLVEFFGDTYGNQYYWLVRRPPFDKYGFLRMMEFAQPVSEDDILSMNINYETGSIYSWYRLVPTGDVLGVTEQNTMIPAVFFPEYATIWGSKPLDVQSMYYNYIYSGQHDISTDKQKNENVNNITHQMILDFKYLIESNAYRPFSMAGTITLKGSRKLKRGTMIQLDDGMVFHIDSVSHSYEISESSVRKITTLQVSHGIYSQYIGEKNVGSYGKVGYFNLIDFNNFNIEDYDNANYRDKISQWKVNINCLRFFLGKVHLVKNS